eukprot:gene14516-17136_t
MSTVPTILTKTKKGELFQAAKDGDQTKLQNFIEHDGMKADQSFKDDTGSAPIHRAASNGSSVIVEKLIKADKNANIDTQNTEGDTAAHIACLYSHGDLVQLLLSLGADFSITNKEGKTPTELASPTIKYMINEYK